MASNDSLAEDRRQEDIGETESVLKYVEQQVHVELLIQNTLAILFMLPLPLN